MSVQERHMLHEEDERSLGRYRRQCMQDMHELESGDAFLDVIEKEHRKTLVVVHIYQQGVKGCDELNACLDCLAVEYPSVKFCRIDAMASGASERFSSEVLPALLVYKAGEPLGSFLSVTKRLGHEFFATDLEAFLSKYGLLPEKEFTACPGDEQEG